MSRSGWNHNPPRGHNPAGGGADAQNVVDQGRARREAELVAQYAARQPTPVRPTTSVEPGVTFRKFGVPCLVLDRRNERLPKDFKGPRKVPNYTTDLSPAAWIESYEMAMELLDLSEAACAKYFP